MEYLEIHPENPQGRLIQKAVDALADGGVVAYPSDTTYALAVDIFNKRAVEKLYAIKREDKSKLFSCIFYDFSILSEYARIETDIYRILKHYLPGPYTFILNGTNKLPKMTLTKRKTIGVRMPDSNIIRDIATRSHSILLSCGIKLDANNVFTEPYEIKEKLGHALDIIIDSGEIPYNPSTVISFENGNPEIVRQGAGKFEL